jgi:hypothetical protein
MRQGLTVLLVVLTTFCLGCSGNGAKGKNSGKDMPKPAASDKQDQ